MLNVRTPHRLVPGFSLCLYKLLILVVESTRVVLKSKPSAGCSQYINANYVSVGVLHMRILCLIHVFNLSYKVIE